jgi:hypothetical protein
MFRGTRPPASPQKKSTGSTLSLPLVLDGVGWSTARPDRFTPEKDPLLFVQEAGWAPGPVWIDAENLASTGIRSPDCPARSESI